MCVTVGLVHDDLGVTPLGEMSSLVVRSIMDQAQEITRHTVRFGVQ
jgi:hypothetical protein